MEVCYYFDGYKIFHDTMAHGQHGLNPRSVCLGGDLNSSRQYFMIQCFATSYCSLMYFEVVQVQYTIIGGSTAFLFHYVCMVVVCASILKISSLTWKTGRSWSWARTLLLVREHKHLHHNRWNASHTHTHTQRNLRSAPILLVENQR